MFSAPPNVRLNEKEPDKVPLSFTASKNDFYRIDRIAAATNMFTKW